MQDSYLFNDLKLCPIWLIVNVDYDGIMIGSLKSQKQRDKKKL